MEAPSAHLSVMAAAQSGISEGELAVLVLDYLTHYKHRYKLARREFAKESRAVRATVNVRYRPRLVPVLVPRH